MKFNFKTMLATIGLLAVAVPSTLSVVACGSTPSESQKTELQEILKITSLEGDITEDNLIAELLKANQGTRVKASDLKVVAFTPAEIGKNGSGQVRAVANSKYQGAVAVEIKKEISLEYVWKALKVEADETNDSNGVLEKILALNPDSKVSRDDVEVTTFVPADSRINGLAVITAKSESKFVGYVDVTIMAYFDLANKTLNSIISSIKNSGSWGSWWRYFEYCHAAFTHKRDIDPIVVTQEELTDLKGHAQDISERVFRQAISYTQQIEEKYDLVERRNKIIKSVDYVVTDEENPISNIGDYLKFNGYIAFQTSINTETIKMKEFTLLYTVK